MLYKTKTAGSIMIMGEHSVLHSYSSIAASIDKYVYVAFKKAAAGKIYINSDYFGDYETDIEQIKFVDHFDIILTILEKYKKFLSEGVSVQIKSEFSPEFGLGSSAAILVGTLSALMLMLKKKLSKYELFLEALSILKQIRKSASGSDLAASIYQGVVYFNSKDCTVEIIANTLPIIVAYSGYKTKTEDVVKLLNHQFVASDLNINRVYVDNGELTEKAALAIRSKNYLELGRIMNASNSIIYENLNLMTDELQNIIKEFRAKDFIYGAKISGAGLGDCAIAISDNSKCYMRLNNIEILPVAISSSNIREEFSSESTKSLNKIDIVNKILGGKIYNKPIKKSATATACSNIAICKYWGKRDEDLHLPVNSSLSISLDDFISTTTISLSDEDKIELNGKILNTKQSFGSRLFNFIDLFRQNNNFKFFIKIHSNIPIAAGLASSAAGFASITLVLNDFLDWNLDSKQLSILARLGSGSASRSIERGFVKWHKGSRLDGMDSYAEKLLLNWSDLCFGILIASEQEKSVSSRDAMKITKTTSPLFKSWSKKASQDIDLLISAIKKKDFLQFGKILEENSDYMHNVMATSKPSLVFGNSVTEKIISKIKFCRITMKLPVFYTQDAGSNLVIFFEKKNLLKIKSFFAAELLDHAIGRCMVKI